MIEYKKNLSFPSFVASHYLHPPDVRAKFLLYNLLEGGCITYWGAQTAKIPKFFLSSQVTVGCWPQWPVWHLESLSSTKWSLKIKDSRRGTTAGHLDSASGDSESGRRSSLTTGIIMSLKYIPVASFNDDCIADNGPIIHPRLEQ